MDTSKATASQGDGRRRRTATGAAANVEPSTPATFETPQASEPTSAVSEGELIDPRDPQTQTRLKQRLPGGAYDIPEVALVKAIRAWAQRGDQVRVRMLCETLVDRCIPEFQRRAWGLRHRPELMEDAIAGMIEQLLREAQDPRETFMTLNFIHYLRCLCADNFGRVLRQEGLSYRRDEHGRPAGRPLHVPQALVERIDVSAEDREGGEGAAAQGTVVADPRDEQEERMAALEAQRILNYLPDPLDRQIMALRALEHLRWDDIAKLCGKTERTMRLRYEKAVVKLRQCIEAEQSNQTNAAAVAR